MKIIGHRGARGLAPENTLAALKKGLEHHVDQLEFDLRVTSDGIVVLHHNGSIADPAGQKYRISAHTHQELLDHKPDLATFERALETVGRKACLYIEVKRHEPTAPIVKIIKAYLAKGWKPDHVYLASKHQKTLLAMHRALPELPTIVIEPWSGVRAHYRARQLGTKTVSMRSWWLWRGFIRGFKGNGWQLYAYTLNDPAKARRWARYGLAGVVTDYPDRFEK